MIGNWKSNVVIGSVGIGLWSLAFGWYFVGNHRLHLAWERLLTRLGRRPADQAKPRRNPRPPTP